MPHSIIWVAKRGLALQPTTWTSACPSSTAEMSLWGLKTRQDRVAWSALIGLISASLEEGCNTRWSQREPVGRHSEPVRLHLRTALNEVKGLRVNSARNLLLTHSN